jgi:hypothetical protein
VKEEQLPVKEIFERQSPPRPDGVAGRTRYHANLGVAQRVVDEGGEWVAVFEFPAEKRSSAVSTASRIKTGKAKSWASVARFDATTRRQDDGTYRVYVRLLEED